MHSHLTPCENARRYIFSDEDCLYRDHFGRRIVVDLEGSGLAVVEDAERALVALIDEAPADGFPWTYDQNLTVAALGPGTVSIRILEGASAQANGRFQGPVVTVELPHLGCGWVVGASTEFSLDERHDPAPTPSVELPVPFYRSLSGTGTARIVPASTTCELIDAFDIEDQVALQQRGFVVQNISKLSELSSCFADATHRTGMVASHLNKATWRIALPEGCRGLRLRKIYDRFHGRQRARVFIDGAFVSYWYEASQDRKCRWQVSDFGIPGSFVEGKTSIEIAIDPPPGTPLWSVSRFEVFSLS